VKRKAHGFFVFEYMQLEQTRQEIDEIDARIFGLLDQRAKIVREIGEMKLKAGLPILDWRREADMIMRASQNNPGTLSNDAITRIYRAILHESRELQRELAESIAANGVVRS
jgi:chorismate mutase